METPGIKLIVPLFNCNQILNLFSLDLLRATSFVWLIDVSYVQNEDDRLIWCAYVLQPTSTQYLTRKCVTFIGITWKWQSKYKINSNQFGRIGNTDLLAMQYSSTPEPTKSPQYAFLNFAGSVPHASIINQPNRSSSMCYESVDRHDFRLKLSGRNVRYLLLILLLDLTSSSIFSHHIPYKAARCLFVLKSVRPNCPLFGLHFHFQLWLNRSSRIWNFGKQLVRVGIYAYVTLRREHTVHSHHSKPNWISCTLHVCRASSEGAQEPERRNSQGKRRRKKKKFSRKFTQHLLTEVLRFEPYLLLILVVHAYYLSFVICIEQRFFNRSKQWKRYSFD